MIDPLKDIIESADADVSEENTAENDKEGFRSSFDYRAVPLDEQMTLDEHGIPFTLKELMDIKELKDD